jgi:uncharacterized radical SAM superfamily Fe-S cluster-containing enzyme
MKAATAGLDHDQGNLIKSTGSICPVCLEPVTAQVRERSGQVWMDKTCTEHGEFSALLSADVRHYYKSEKDPQSSGSCCGPSSCSLPVSATEESQGTAPWLNHSCTILIEIIERCNLSCPTCFAGSTPQHSGLMCLDEFTRQVDRLAEGGKRGSDMIQLSGGEPTIHPDFFRMIEVLFERGFHQVCVNSNGIKLAKESFANRLADCMARYAKGQIFVYLQFDGFDDRTHLELRGRADLLEIKRSAMQNCHEAGIKVHPVMTLTRGVNDHEVGDFVRLAVENPWLKNVVIQPAMYSGRYDNPRRVDRLTLADTVSLICEQFGEFSPRDFMPIPCSDPNCFGMASALRTKKGLVPVSRYFPAYENWGSDNNRDLIERFTDTINGPQALAEAIRWVSSESQAGEILDQLEDDEVDSLLDVLAGLEGGEELAGDLWDNILTISIKPFMDAWTYDQDRIDKCCVHILDHAGNPVSFCEFNAVNRPRSMQAAAGSKNIDVLHLEVANP